MPRYLPTALLWAYRLLRDSRGRSFPRVAIRVTVNSAHPRQRGSIVTRRRGSSWTSKHVLLTALFGDRVGRRCHACTTSAALLLCATEDRPLCMPERPAELAPQRKMQLPVTMIVALLPTGTPPRERIGAPITNTPIRTVGAIQRVAGVPIGANDPAAHAAGGVRAATGTRRPNPAVTHHGPCLVGVGGGRDPIERGQGSRRN